MNQNFRIFTSSIGSKLVMATTGIFLICFLIAHLIGNLEIFYGQETFNIYAEFLRSVPKLLWALRILLILAFVLHIGFSIALSIKNRKARPIVYAKKHSVKASAASRTMMLSGLVVLAFVIFHLAHLTWGWVNPEYAHLIDAKGRPDVYNIAILGFQNIFIVIFYIIALILLGFHLSHGFSSSAQTLGVSSKGFTKFLHWFGIVFSVVIVLLYLSIPIAVWFGLLAREF